MNLNDRISRLENRNSKTAFRGFKFIIQDSIEQVEFPSRFRKVLVSDASSGKFPIYRLVRK